MIWAIPDANQTFRRDHLRRGLASRSRTTSGRRSSSTNFPTWSSTPGTSPPNGGGWKDVLVADTSKPDARTCIMARRGRLILDRAKQTVDLVLTTAPAIRTAAPTASRSRPIASRSELIVSLDPKTVFPRIEICRAASTS